MRALLIILGASLLLAFAKDNNKGLIVKFERAIYEPGKAREVVSGLLYFQQPSTLLVEVQSPVHQWMIFKKNLLLVSYPEDKKGFRIKSSSNPLTLPFVTAFVACNDDNFGFPDLGFSVQRTENLGDTLLTVWTPPKEALKLIQSAKCYEVRNNLVQMESMKPDGSLHTRSTYKGHTKINNSIFPMEIYNGWMSTKGWVREDVLFKNPQSVKVLPDSLLNFTIPNTYSVKDIEW